MSPSRSFRPATAADYPVFARLFQELATGDPTPSPEAWASVLLPNTFVLEDASEIAGYVYLEVLDGLGYIRHIVVDPAHRRRGVGRALMREAARRIREAGIERWCLNVKPDNEPAVRLYEQMGMRIRHSSVSMRMDWSIESRLPAPSSALVTAELPPADDPATEEALGLPRGLLSRQRERPDARLLICRQGARAVGLAVFSPSFPGAYPFRAQTPEITRALLTAMRPHADPNFGYVQLVFEGAPDLAQVFEAAGATRHLEFVHLAGPVPGP